MEIVAINQISPDQVILWSWGFITINVTIIYTWLVMAILVVGSWLVTRNLSSGINVSRWQHFLEVVISTIRGEIREMTKKGVDDYVPLIGTLFLFICRLQCPGYCSRICSAHGINNHDSGAGTLRIYCCSLLRHFQKRRASLFKRILSAQFYLFPVPRHG